MSASCCEAVWEKALHLSQGTAKALGLARTDIYFDKEWNADNKCRFYQRYPEARNKKYVSMHHRLREMQHIRIIEE